MNNKLLIKAYKNIKYQESDKLGELTVQINPESYKLGKSVLFAPREKVANAAQTPGFKKYSPSTLSFDVIFDGTGVIPTGGKSVNDRIDELDNLLYQMVGATREPGYVIIAWGDFTFHGRLNKADYAYTLFKPNGAPLRAKVSLSFTDALSVEEEQALKAQKAQQGQYKIVTADKTLPEMCQDVYGNAGYAGLIANINGLDGFRDLKPGTQIWFPKG